MKTEARYRGIATQKTTTTRDAGVQEDEETFQLNRAREVSENWHALEMREIRKVKKNYKTLELNGIRKFRRTGEFRSNWVRKVQEN